ncbi:hypothetical protein CAPTEDRAFT_180693 [Capitella teleta]|uniref:Phospholipid scramblase n=1 Tax=Capitella teleta TaxID=283909 RepID=R7TIN7_CAPTE|nr:hypothetical protein CAPTEDRAFT_180693 [Capitella teleta]|eukprot:ELT93599.1 hypothetical protein CAPTEDRAFT_180693 [Capitella teleta]
MERPSVAAGCPPGLEYLTQIDQLVVKQQVEIMELITSWECANKYRVMNSVGQQVYFAQEESETCMRQCCGPSRSFIIHITDNAGREVLRLKRDFKCCAMGLCWCAGMSCCSHEVVVESPVGQIIGYVRHSASAWRPKFTLYTGDEQEIGHIKGPLCICKGPCCGDIDFPVMSNDGETKIGNVAKQWSGALREFFTDADTFSISFPMDMDVKMKGVMIGALFLIDFMFFEESKNNNH